MDYYEKNRIIWKEIIGEIFPTGVPQHCEWSGLNQIVSILNIIGSRENSNHMFYPTGGGMDIESAKLSTEKGCIEIFTGLTEILKPKCLSFQSFNNDRWNYFRIDTDALQPSGIYGEVGDEVSEELTELEPLHYVPRSHWDSEEYNGDPLPKGARVLTRYLKGSFVIFSKSSPYNQHPTTYDGRHDKMNAEQFRSYIEGVIANGWK